MKLNKYFKPTHILLSILVILFFIIFGVFTLVAVGTNDISDICTVTISFIYSIGLINIYFFHLRKISQILLDAYREWLEQDERVSLTINVINDICELYYIFSGTIFGILVMIGLVVPMMYMILWFRLDMEIFETVVCAIIIYLSSTITFLNIFKIIRPYKNIQNTYIHVYDEIMRR